MIKGVCVKGPQESEAAQSSKRGRGHWMILEGWQSLRWNFLFFDLRVWICLWKTNKKEAEKQTRRKRKYVSSSVGSGMEIIRLGHFMTSSLRFPELCLCICVGRLKTLAPDGGEGRVQWVGSRSLWITVHHARDTQRVIEAYCTTRSKNE